MTDALSIPLGFEKSPNWRGYAWYRFQNPNYHRMATQKTDHGGCGSAHEIWMHTKHPTTIGTTIKAAFCHEETDIRTAKNNFIHYCFVYFFNLHSYFD